MRFSWKAIFSYRCGMFFGCWMQSWICAPAHDQELQSVLVPPNQYFGAWNYSVFGVGMTRSWCDMVIVGTAWLRWYGLGAKWPLTFFTTVETIHRKDQLHMKSQETVIIWCRYKLRPWNNYTLLPVTFSSLSGLVIRVERKGVRPIKWPLYSAGHDSSSFAYSQRMKMRVGSPPTSYLKSCCDLHQVIDARSLDLRGNSRGLDLKYHTYKHKPCGSFWKRTLKVG